MPGRNSRRMKKALGQANALPGQRRDPEQMHPLDRRYHEIVGDLSFVPPGHMTPEELESVENNAEVQALIQEYLNTPPEGVYEEPLP